MTDTLDTDLILSVHCSQSLIKHTLLRVEIILFSTPHRREEIQAVSSVCFERLSFSGHMSQIPRTGLGNLRCLLKESLVAESVNSVVLSSMLSVKR